ncbi:MAG: FecR domain-containing protein [Proteobacteria bacterium]|nr:FecR domain-containing protein [Pseudomonadota bacterium]
MEKIDKKPSRISRRQWFRQIGDMTIFSTIMLELSACTIKPVAKYKEWADKAKNRDDRGVAGINSLSGRATLNGRELNTKDKIPSGESVILHKNSHMFIKLPDNSVVKIKGEAKFALNLGSKEGGILNLEYGSMLAVIKKKRRRKYLFRGALAVVGIKGTVFFGYVLKKGETPPVKFPSNSTEYFCLCNGKADYISESDKNIMMTDESYHHNSYFIGHDTKGPKFIPAEVVIEHSDKEIDELIETMEGEKHDKKWLWGPPYDK